MSSTNVFMSLGIRTLTFKQIANKVKHKKTHATVNFGKKTSVIIKYRGNSDKSDIIAFISEYFQVPLFRVDWKTFKPNFRQNVGKTYIYIRCFSQREETRYSNGKLLTVGLKKCDTILIIKGKLTIKDIRLCLSKFFESLVS